MLSSKQVNFWKFGLQSVLGGLLLVSAIGCTKTEKIIERQAPADINESFAGANCSTAVCLNLKKESFGKVFLMMVSGRGGGATPQWYDFKPQVVSFELTGNKVALYEENYLSVYEEIKNRELIQTFQVTAQNADSVTFAWGEGLKTLVYESPIETKGPDGNPSAAQTSPLEVERQFYPVIDSVSRRARITDNLMEINQISRIRSFDTEKGFSDETLSMNIQLMPYAPSEGFNKRVADPSRKVGFFTTNTGVKGFSQKVEALVNHWNAEKPIQVLVSKSVPKEFEAAVVEGIKYWNHVYGKEVLQVQTGADPATEPQLNTIIVRWIPWLDSGAAYALHQTDPLTGEILRGQVFMPSVFTRVGSADLLELNGGQPVKASQTVAKGQGYVACDLTSKLSNLNELMQEASDSKRLKLAQDSVRSTMAHELGHALGMRHNFAGSFSAKVTRKTIQESAARYFAEPDHAGLETSTSIMDYNAGIDDVLLSARLKKSALSYDKMAMDYALTGKAPSSDVSYFCTDEDISIAKAQKLEIYGCERFDAGNNPLYSKFEEFEFEKNSFLKVIFTSIIGRKFPSNQSEAEKATDVILEETKQWMQIRSTPLEFVSKAVFDLQSDSKVSSRFVSLEKYLKAPYAAAQGEDPFLSVQLKKDVQEIGGISSLYQRLLLNQDQMIDTEWYLAQLNELMKQPYFAGGSTLAGRPFTLSADDQKKIGDFLLSFEELNRFSLVIGVNKFLVPKVITTEEGSARMVLKKGLQDLSLEGLAQTSIAWTQTESDEVKAKVGPGLAQEIILPQYLFAGKDRAVGLSLVMAEFMGPTIEEQRLKVAAELGKKSASVLSVAFGAEVPAIATSAELEKLIEAAKQQKVIDEITETWLKNEAALMKVLEPKKAPGKPQQI